MSKAKFGGGLIADFAKIQSTGKMDAIGIFTQFNAWGFPCKRSWFLVFTTIDVSDQEAIIITLKKPKSKSYDTLAVLDIKPSNSTLNRSYVIQLNANFNNDGSYELISTFENSKRSLKVPFKVQLLPWPEFSPEEIQTVSNFKQIPHKINVTINCQECSHVYIFEESLLPNEQVSGGTLRFPDDGVFECQNCGHILNLKDIQGMVRSSIKENILTILKNQ